MTPPTSTARAWVATELAKDIEAGLRRAADARTRVESPPEPALGVVYHEIAEAAARHAAAVETIAVRYGYTPSHGVGGGIGAALGRLRDRAGEIGSSPLALVSRDLEATADAIHRHTAWVGAFEALGDLESTRELKAVLGEEKTHREALQQSLGRLVLLGARGDEPAEVTALRGSMTGTAGAEPSPGEVPPTMPQVSAAP